jgi:hypothetical protein
MFPVNGTLPTIVIVAGLALAGYALLMTALNRRMGIGLPASVRILCLMTSGNRQSSPGRRQADGCRPPGLGMRPASAGIHAPASSVHALS